MSATFDKLKDRWQFEWDANVEALGNKAISFGTAGIINTLVKCSLDPPLTKKNVLLVNGATIIRNVLNREVGGKKISERDIPNAVSEDINQLRTYFNNYSSSKSFVLFFFNSSIYKLIPEKSRRNLTEDRQKLLDLTGLIVKSEKLEANKLHRLSQDQQMITYGVEIKNRFSHKVIPSVLSREFIDGFVPKVLLVSHCALDYLMFDSFRNIELIDSHTGKITSRKDLGVKLWKDNEIPFNPMTLKLFGDKDFIQPLVSQRPAALKKLGNIKLKTEVEIKRLALEKLGLVRKDFDWEL